MCIGVCDWQLLGPMLQKKPTWRWSTCETRGSKTAVHKPTDDVTGGSPLGSLEPNTVLLWWVFSYGHRKTENVAESQTSKQKHNLKSKRYNYADVTEFQPNMHTCIFNACLRAGL